MSNSATPWNVAHLDPLSINSPGKNTGVSCHFYSRESSPPMNRNCISYVSCIGRQILYHGVTKNAPILHLILAKRPFTRENVWCNLPLEVVSLSLFHHKVLPPPATLFFVFKKTQNKQTQPHKKPNSKSLSTSIQS